MPPSCAIAIAMSASVTVSIAEDRIGMLSGISRVRKVRVSAWLGSTSDSSGCSRTSSKVRPSGISGASLSWAISAHDRQQRDSPSGRLVGGPLRAPAAPLRRASARSSRCRTARRRRGTPRPAPRAIDFGLRSARRPVARVNLVGVDQALAVEAQPPALLGFGEKPSGSSRLLNTPSNAAIPQRAQQGRSSAAIRRSVRGWHPAAAGGRRANRSSRQSARR